MGKRIVEGLAGSKRAASGRMMAASLVSRLEVLEALIAAREDVLVQVRGLTRLFTEYVGFLKARKVMNEAAETRGTAFRTWVEVSVLDDKHEKLTTTVWQGMYRDAAQREANAGRVFYLQLRVLEAELQDVVVTFKGSGEQVKLRTNSITVLDDEGTKPVPEDFAAQYSDDETLISIKRQLAKVLDPKKRREIYLAMRASEATYGKYYEALKAAGFDYRAGEVAPTEVKEVVEAKPATQALRIEGMMTFAKIAAILRGYGQLPAEGEEADDPDWQGFVEEFLAVNGQQAKGPLMAALREVRKEPG